jgi:hypothetical protein
VAVAVVAVSVAGVDEAVVDGDEAPPPLDAAVVDDVAVESVADP